MTAEMVLRRYGQVSRLRYCQESRPGLSWARLAGLRRARGEFVAFTDDDVRVDPHWLAELIGAFQVTDKVACTTGLVLPAEIETPAQAWAEQFGERDEGRRLTRQVFNMTTHRPPSPLYPYLPPVSCGGVSMAFRTSVLRELGGFDPALGAGTMTGGAEDVFAFFQIVMSGYDLVYEPSAMLYHFHRRDDTELRHQLGNYGIGFTAFLTRCLLDDPRRLHYLAVRLPAALRTLVSGASRIGQRGSDYPRGLTWLQLRGMLYGPMAYLRSYWHSRRVINRLDSITKE